jgi:hypothetical protein
VLTARAARPLAALAAALPLALTACGDESATGGTPPLLRLSDASLAASAAADTAGGASGSAGWKLAGTLPSGIPGARPVYDVAATSVARGDVEHLAAALHAASVRKSGGGWVARGSGSTLLVTESGQWTYGALVCPDAVASVDLAECPVASGVGTSSSGTVTAAPGSATDSPIRDRGTPVRAHPCRGDEQCGVVQPSPPPVATLAETRAAAAPVLDALGLTALPANAGPGYVTVERSLPGTPTVGYTTALTVDADGAVIGGSGWLGEPRRGPSYPLVSARTAFDSLVTMPVPLPAIACPITAMGRSLCPAGQPRVVTGATLGLTLTYRDDGRPILVPAWLFDVRGSDVPVAQIAVAPRYLGAPVPPSVAPVPPDQPIGTKPGGGGSIGSAEPGPAVPPDQPDQPGQTSELTPSSYRLEDGGRTLVLQVTDGICVPARYDGATKEGESTVVVTVTKTETATPDPDKACPEIARIFDVPVALDAPLGDRTVQTADGTEVPRAENR